MNQETMIAATPSTPSEFSLSLGDTVTDALEAAGATPGTVAAARLSVIRGQALGSFTQTVRDQGATQHLPMIGILDELTRLIAGGKDISRLAALVAEERFGGATAEPGHYPWCQPNACITKEYEAQDGSGSYTEHVGPSVDLEIGTEDDGVELSAVLGANESLTDDRPSVYLADTNGDGCILEGANLDKAIDNTQKFVDSLRAMRYQASQERAE
jgi:hypothetical protein